jgi:hypothetical protein
MQGSTDEINIVQDVITPHPSDQTLISNVVDLCGSGRHVFVCGDSDTYLNAICYAAYKEMSARVDLVVKRIYPATSEELLKIFNQTVGHLTIEQAMSETRNSSSAVIIPDVLEFGDSDWLILSKLLKTFGGANIGVLIFARRQDASSAPLAKFISDMKVSVEDLPSLTREDILRIALPDTHHLKGQSDSLMEGLARDFKIKLDADSDGKEPDSSVSYPLRFKRGPFRYNIIAVVVLFVISMTLGVYQNTYPSEFSAFLYRMVDWMRAIGEYLTAIWQEVLALVLQAL